MVNEQWSEKELKIIFSSIAFRTGITLMLLKSMGLRKRLDTTEKETKNKTNTARIVPFGYWQRYNSHSKSLTVVFSVNLMVYAGYPFA